MFPFTLKCLHLDNKSYDQPNSSQSGRGIQDFLEEIEIETTGSQVQLVRKTKTNSGNETLGMLHKMWEWAEGLQVHDIASVSPSSRRYCVITEVLDVGGVELGNL